MSRGATYLTSQYDASVDARIQEYRRKREKDFPDAWSGPNSWTSRFDAGCFVLAPIFARSAGGHNARVLEIGCGQGQKALSYAPFVGSVLGIDIEGDHISHARVAAQKMASPNVTFERVEAANVNEILEKDRFDIIMIYAVMEHLTPNERLDLLSAIWGALGDEGMIVMGETPNRIASCDYHSTFLPFVDSLNDDYYLQYVDRFTPREDWRPGISRCEDRVLGSYRAGRGVSFHEFDLFLGKLGEIGNYIVQDSFEALTRNMYPLRRFEVAILEETRWQGNVIDQFFSRSWLEGIIAKSAGPQNRARREFSLVAPSLSTGVAEGLEAHGLRAYGLKGKEQFVSFRLPPAAHTFQLLIDVRSGEGQAQMVDQRGEVLEEIDVAELASILFPGGSYAALDRTVPPGTNTITIRPAGDSVIVVGDLGVFGVGSLGALDPRTPKILERGNF